MILQIYRDFLKPGAESAFRRVEEDAARICAEFGCPNCHLAIESATTPTEVWWLTEYETEADIQQIIDAYAANPALTAALAEIPRRKEHLVGKPLDVFATYRSDLSRGIEWSAAGARFVVATITRNHPQLEGSVFETAAGTRFVLKPARTRDEADAIAASAPDTIVFAVRPYWGMPAQEWIDADPEFWSVNPMRARSA